MTVRGTLFFGLLAIWVPCAISGCRDDQGINENSRDLKPHKIIPLPSKVTISGEETRVPDQSGMYVHGDFQEAGKVIADAFMGQFDIQVVPDSGDSENCLIRIVPDESLEADAYRLEVGGDRILFEAGGPQGAFYAAQTFRQILWNAESDSSSTGIVIQNITVYDQPKNRYRGFHMDLSRHLFQKEFIFKIIDCMALYKLNKLQLHLTDDQGWRIQIDKYPKLTSVGGFREFNAYDRECLERAKNDADYNLEQSFVNGEVYGGYYTKQEIRDIVEYAGKNFIDVIPEIDMPGHMSAAIRAYPELALSCSGDTNWGEEFSEPLCVCRSGVMQFVMDVWQEVLELFPCEYVHLGADEVDKSFWATSSDCQEFMDLHHFDHENMIQSFFVNEMYAFFSANDKKMIAWDDVMVSNNDNIVNEVDPGIHIMYWRDYKPESADLAARNGNPVILAPWSWFYLSSEASDENLKKLYYFNEKNELSAAVLEKKIGYQACVWTEIIPSGAVFERQIFPRFQAYSEVAWSNPSAWDSFIRRMPAHLDYLEANNIKYTRSKYFN
jgi:hexosaminidase